MPNSDVQEVITRLSEIGIDTSLPPAQLAEFLGLPDFTPYPAFAGALFTLLARGLKKPVFIDVIAFNYENTPGIASPRKVEDVDVALLKKAVLDGSNERHGEHKTDFSSLLK
ncbi:hypothetical protein ABIF97_001015 [Bradyrhizobium japonicum]